MSDVVLWAGSSRDVARVEKATAREVAKVRGHARVIEARHAASVNALGAVASEALFVGANLTRQAATLAQSVPGSEHLSGRVLDAASAAMAQIVTDTARDLRS